MTNADCLREKIAMCRICAERFAATATGHRPRPVVWFEPSARLLIVGQAPGLRVHESGKPFDDASGRRLRDWMGIGPEQFYDKTKVAIVPMAFCFPGYDAKGSDLAPPAICAATWRDQVMAVLKPRLTLLIGAYAQRWHLRKRIPVSDAVAGWRDNAPEVFPLPHPSWRNTGWLKRNDWFERDLLPELRSRVHEVLDDPA
ncbi:uracil-DNA glycosylase family protein [Paracoccus albus]|uniref:uracil-DNA glycosylase family protein n=1 Tax=Paracoccus albus TaxID=3017784 RepID=UPI0022F14071|nr:uracil-DNA glycosylase family protein [Paracoccus albus]WBU61019.1 uracil-DNA glycosylase family protein [Paracoccus albus]